jgi:microcystin-dependent protein
VLAAVDNLGGSPAGVVNVSAADSLGGVDGSEQHLLTVNQMPSHTHTMGSAGAHSHSYKGGGQGFGHSDWPDMTGTENDSGGSQRWSSGDIASAGAHTHSINSSGGGQPHSIMQPSMFVNFLIKK